MLVRRKVGHEQADPAQQRKLLGLRSNIDEALKRVMRDYREMEHKARLASTELKLARSELQSVHQDFAREANLLSFLFSGLKTPLSAIEDRIASLVKGDQHSGAEANSLYQVRAEVHKLWQIIVDLAAVEAVQSGTTPLKLERVQLEKVVDRMVYEHKRRTASKGVVLHKVIARELPMILGDRKQLKVALSHLVNNAVCHTPMGGVVTLLANGTRPRNRVQLDILDLRRDALDEMEIRALQGVIPGKDVMDTDLGDVDLELMVAWQIIRAHKGEITVESDAEKGTIFSLTFPVAGKAAANGDKPL